MSDIKKSDREELNKRNLSFYEDLEKFILGHQEDSYLIVLNNLLKCAFYLAYNSDEEKQILFDAFDYYKNIFEENDKLSE